ncbi:MAG: hypothetical protein ABSC64_17525 [Candidatus Korobacteraceae bacterium]|jgi:hypothetical protein
MNAIYQRLKELDPGVFEDLCFQIIAARHPLAHVTHVNGAGGDKGVDIFQGELGAQPTIWQCKFFVNGIRSAQKNQIKKSLRVALHHFQPKRWILCVPVDLDINVHAWLQQLKREYISRVEVGMFQASEIVGELAYRRPIRNSFFPNAILDPLELRSLLAKTGEYSDRELEKLTLENVQQYVQRLQDRDARFDYQVTFFPRDNGRTNFPPGIMASITDGDKRIDIFARDVEALQLDPPKIQFKTQGEATRQLRHAVETGTPADIQVSGFRSTFDFIAPVPAESQRLIFEPSPHAHAPIQLSVIFGAGESAVRYDCLKFRRSRVGTKEVELSTVDASLPFSLSMVVRPGTAPPEITFHFKERFRGKDIRPVRQFAAAIFELKKTGLIEVRDFQRGALVFTATTNPNQYPELNDRFKVLLDEICEIANRFHVRLPVPAVVDEHSVESVPFFLKLARKGEVQVELSNISVTLAKSTQDKDMFVAALGSEKSFKFDLVEFVAPDRIFDTDIQIGPCSIVAQRALIKNPEEVLQRYLSAKDGEGFVVQFETLAPARIILGSGQFGGGRIPPSTPP